MAVTRLEIHARAPYAEGVAFGSVGPYERLDGIIHFAVEPGHPANATIVDLGRAPRGEDGRVHFASDFTLLQPADPNAGNRRLLLDVVNRGRRTATGVFNRAPRAIVPTEAIHPGDGFLFRRGWTVAACGWQWDVRRGPGLMGIDAPPALDRGAEIEGQTIVQFQPNAPERSRLLADRLHAPYPAVEDDATATLTVRDWLDGPRTIIGRDRWRFARDEAGVPVADAAHVWLEGGFAPGRIYELLYRTRRSPVVGSGLLAVREAATFLRHGTADEGNPGAGRLDWAFAFGASQSGRFLRTFLYNGLNVDEAGRQVFDGVLPFVAGAHRGEFNHRYAQPSVQATRGFGQLPPFADGGPDGLLARQHAAGGMPKIIHANTSAEYWPGDVSRGDASLLHIAEREGRDLEPPSETRIYTFAGTQHVSGMLPLTDVNPLDGTRGAHAFNILDFSPLARAVLDRLDRWVTAGEEPPPSLVPRLDDGTAVPLEMALATFRAIPGVTVPDPDRLPVSCHIDLGAEAAHGVGCYPAGAGERCPAYVSAVDADGNELAGIRLPEVAAPVATYTGWNPRHAEAGGDGQIVMMLGSTLPFPRTAAERAASGDPRPSIEERYAGPEAYEARARAAAEALAAARFLLPEDVDLAVRNAVRRYEALSAGVEDRV